MLILVLSYTHLGTSWLGPKARMLESCEKGCVNQHQWRNRASLIFSLPPQRDPKKALSKLTYVQSSNLDRSSSGFNEVKLSSIRSHRGKYLRARVEISASFEDINNLAAPSVRRFFVCFVEVKGNSNVFREKPKPAGNIFALGWGLPYPPQSTSSR